MTDMIRFKDIKIGDKFLNKCFNRVDTYDKPIYPHATKVKNVVEVVYINTYHHGANVINQIVFKFVNGAGSITTYDYVSDGVFNSDFECWPDIEINEYYVFKYSIHDNSKLMVISSDDVDYYNSRPQYYKLIGKLHHDYDKTNDHDEITISEV